MSNELKGMLKDIEEEFGLDQCIVCIRPTCVKDALGFPWCEEHEHHGQVISWGYRHRYPEIKFQKFAIGPGDMCWWNAVVCSAETGCNEGNEEFMWAASFHIQDLDSTEEKAS